MAETLRVRQGLEVSGQLLEGSLEASQSFTLTSGSAYISQSVIVADNYGTATLWAGASAPLTTFTYGYIYSDQDIYVQLKTDHGTPEYLLMLVPANTLVFLPGTAGGGTSARLDGAVLVDGTDYDAVVEIKAGRDAADDEGDATVSLYLFA
jgi:hypothetical protein